MEECYSFLSFTIAQAKHVSKITIDHLLLIVFLKKNCLRLFCINHAALAQFLGEHFSATHYFDPKKIITHLLKRTQWLLLRIKQLSRVTFQK